VTPDRSFRPPRLLRDPLVQSVLATVAWRKALVAGRRRHPPSETVVLDAGDGVRLGALADVRAPGAGPAVGRVAILLHGWEGSARSTYLESLRPGLLDDGWILYRLNFRDHGGTHDLNPGLFHSCRIDEVVGAVAAIADRHPGAPVAIAGYSLGGNFALRVALRGPARGIPVRRVVAVNPVIDPADTLVALESGPAAIHRYFVRRWRRSLAAKRRAYPDLYDLTDWLPLSDLRGQTRWLIERHTGYPSLEAYLDGYSIAGDRLRDLGVPATLVTSEDDPIIPVRGARSLRPSDRLTVEIQRRGGHCGYVEDYRLGSWIDRRVRALLRDGAYS